MTGACGDSCWRRLAVLYVLRAHCGKTVPALRAAAIFAPHASRKYLRRFQAPDVDLEVVETLSEPVGFDAVLVFGGDGTIHRYLPTLVRSQVPLLAVPAGSGNDFAAALGLPAIADSLAAWERFRAGVQNVRAVDLGVIHLGGPGAELREVYYCCIAGAGLDSDTNRRANALPWWVRAHGGYVLSALATIFLYRPQAVTLRAADSSGSDDPPARSKLTTLIAFANAPAYGGGMRIAPRARLDDGRLDVCFVSAIHPLRLLRFFPRVFSGSHLGMPEVEYLQTSSLRVESERPMEVFADGEFVGHTPVEVQVAPRALRVVTG